MEKIYFLDKALNIKPIYEIISELEQMSLTEINAKRFEKIFDQPDQIFQKNVHLSLASF